MQVNFVIPGINGLLQRFYSKVLGFDHKDELNSLKKAEKFVWDEITEILALEIEKPTTEDIARQDRQLGKSDHDPGTRRDTAGQTDPLDIRQTDRETQITSSCEEGGKGSHPTLDLDGEVDMQGEGKRGAEYQPFPSLENTEEPTQPTLLQFSGAVPAYIPENEIDQQEISR